DCAFSATHDGGRIQPMTARIHCNDTFVTQNAQRAIECLPSDAEFSTPGAGARQWFQQFTPLDSIAQIIRQALSLGSGEVHRQERIQATLPPVQACAEAENVF